MLEKPLINSTAVTTLSTNDRPVRNIGAAIVLATFGIFGIWAFFAAIPNLKP